MWPQFTQILQEADGLVEYSAERLVQMIEVYGTLAGRDPGYSRLVDELAQHLHAQPLAIGLNCALGAQLMRPYIEELSTVADTYVSAYPNAGLPNPLAETGYDETPAYTASLVKEFAQSGFVNLVGGCCGTTPAHIEAMGKRIAGVAPRRIAQVPPMAAIQSQNRIFSSIATCRCIVLTWFRPLG